MLIGTPLVCNIEPMESFTTIGVGIVHKDVSDVCVSSLYAWLLKNRSMKESCLSSQPCLIESPLSGERP